MTQWQRIEQAPPRVQAAVGKLEWLAGTPAAKVIVVLPENRLHLELWVVWNSQGEGSRPQQTYAMRLEDPQPPG